MQLSNLPTNIPIRARGGLGAGTAHGQCGPFLESPIVVPADFPAQPPACQIAVRGNSAALHRIRQSFFTTLED